MSKNIFLSLLCILFSMKSAFAGQTGGGSGPPPASAEIDLEHGVLKIEKEISEILEVPADQYSKYVLDSALGKPLTIEGRKHATELMDMANGRIILKPVSPQDKRILIQRMGDKADAAITP